VKRNGKVVHRGTARNATAPASGLFDICGGVFVFLTGAPAGWACMVIGCGAVLRAGVALIGFDIAIEPQAATLIAGIVVVVSFAIASLYLTHPAEDLPRLLPGHDVDSERLRVTYGAVSTLIACSATWRFSERVTATAPHLVSHPERSCMRVPGCER
jgi:hypothetical protein